MKAKDLRNLFETFYKERRHELAAAASLIPKDDNSVLYISAGMQPLIPFLEGEKHPKGQRLYNIQPCLRTDDIEEVGDDHHLTLFEMLGNWSLGDYFKAEAIKMSFDFITKMVGLPVERLAVTVHQGNDLVDIDIETIQVWRDLGLKEHQIFQYGDEENWWGPIGETGPCGPDSEMFYVKAIDDCNETCGPSCACGKFIEIGNNVFMAYNKSSDGSLSELEQKNIDVGLGFERLLVIANDLNDVYETDLFKPFLENLEILCPINIDETAKTSQRIIADHMRASCFILAEGVTPSSSGQGYVLRRLIRRVIRHLTKLEIKENVLEKLAKGIIDGYSNTYSSLKEYELFICSELNKEYKKFSFTLKKGLMIADRMIKQSEGKLLSGSDAFKLYETYGFPLELSIELAEEHGFDVDLDGFKRCFKDHQESSRTAGQGKFKGGLSENSEDVIKLHTATHLLNSALRMVLGSEVSQKGSHINNDRLRFDFTLTRKMTKDEVGQVEDIVNGWIDEKLEVSIQEMTYEEAKKLGAIGVFEAKYGEKVKVYKIGHVSIEICGGPHANNTGQLGHFKILKEQSSSAGVRRIKATLENRELN